jgi:hypothetical protein
MRLYLILVMVLLISVCPSFCKEVAYAYGPYGEKPIGQANITDYKGTDVVSFTVSASPRGPSTSYKAQRTVDDIKEEINKKVDKGNDLVRDEGLKLVGNKSGAQRLDQICSIYDYMVINWNFVSDWSGLDVFQYSNYTLKKGSEVSRSGKGDCDDFSILMASLIESIGGTPRIIFAYSPSGGHAYTEVYLGKSNSKDLDRMLKWLRTEYRMNDVNIHADPENGDVWLNMDWWKDSGGATHPGGPFYQATAHIPVYTLETKTALTPIENLPPLVLFSYSPIDPEVGEIVRFNATQSIDPDGRIVDYEWDFGDEDTLHSSSRSICTHVYSSSGPFQVNLTITDSQDDKSSKVLNVDVVEPRPEAVITYSPAEPKVGEVITFDASKSKGISAQIVEYEWDFGDGYSGKRVTIKHAYYDSGTYNAILTVANDKGAKNTSVVAVTVGQKEVASTVIAESKLATPENRSPVIDSLLPDKPSPQNAGSVITWTATASDPENDPILYRFLLNDQPVTDWQTQNRWAWTTGDAPVGDNRIGVKIIDGKHAGWEDFDDQRYVSFAIIADATTRPAILSQSAENSADTPVTIESQRMRGYQVFLDGIFIGTEGTGYDALDGYFSFNVLGNQNHDIRIYDGEFNYPKSMYFPKGVQIALYVEPRTQIRTYEEARGSPWVSPPQASYPGEAISASEASGGSPWVSPGTGSNSSTIGSFWVSPPQESYPGEAGPHEVTGTLG